MIIQCPQCKRNYNLTRRPPKTFKCPKCKFSTSFSNVTQNIADLNGIKQNITNSDDNLTDSMNDKGLNENPDLRTLVVPGLGGSRVTADSGADGLKTHVVPGLQRPSSSSAKLLMNYKGRKAGVVVLPKSGMFELGRNSSDGTARVKLTPDIFMSRIHAAMRVNVLPDGSRQYQITSVKEDNPVYVNDMAIAKGRACTLKKGDRIRMGESLFVFTI